MKSFTRSIIVLFALVLAPAVARALTADFTQDYLSGCSPLVVHFTNTSSGATSYSWDLGNGTTSTLTDVSGSYITPGTYTVVLTATSGGATSTHSVTITVYPSPVVSFHATDTAICPGTSTSFVSTSTLGTSGAGTYLWNFGDGSTSTLSAPTHTYVTPGYYNVTLIVTNSMGCATSLTLPSYIHVFNPPNINFGVSATYFCHAPGHAVFTNISSGAGSLVYSWDFGDGGTSSSATPTHDYTTPGTYTVKLYVTDGNGCRDSLVRPSYIFVGNTSASFTYTSTLCANSRITFFNTSGSHITSSWNFGDGGTSTGDTTLHVYSAAGTYNVRLVDYNGHCYDTVIHTVTVLAPPSASFTSSPTAPCPAPATINFSGSVPSGSTVTWLFGDGSTGTGSSPSHTYAANGTDTVLMIVTDSHGCTDTVQQINNIFGLYVHASPSLWDGCVPLTVRWTPVVTYGLSWATTYPYGIASYHWSFGDGTTSTSSSASPSHTYTATGVYTCILTIVTANGCTALDTQIVRVGSPPVVTFTSTPDHICYGDTVRFVTHIVRGPVDNYYYNFGDGSSSYITRDSTFHLYMYPGTFHDTLIAYYHGCPSTPVWDTVVVDSPMAIISVGFLCSPYTSVQCFDSSYGDDTHMWFFSDGASSSLDNPTHTFPSLGTYTVTLTTYNARSGCRDTNSTTLDFNPPVVHILATDSAVCPDAVISFVPDDTAGVRSHYWFINGTLLDDDTGRVFTDTFHITGRYTVTLVIKDNIGCLDTFTRTNWVIVGKPVDSFIASPVTGCWPLTVTFTDRSTDVTGAYPVGYAWAFGDGTTSTVTTAVTTHTYTAAGTYSVREIVTDNIGCKDTGDRASLITVWRPHAVFYTSNNYPCIGASVHFTNISTGTTGAFWMFGDGDTSSVSSPNHTYLTAGTYTVRLVVFDSHGCTDTAAYASYISVTKPTAAFHMDDSFAICPPLNVHFFNTSSGATSYSWAFGDGGTSVLASPSDLYTSTGFYTVTLVAVNSHGCRDTARGLVTLYGSAGGFTYTPLSGCSPLTVYFHASLSNVPSITWDFADGNTAVAAYSDTVSHVYTIPGAYVPKLILSDNTGCQNSSLGIDTIKVDGLHMAFTTIPDPVCVNTDIHFKDVSTSLFSTVNGWHWLFSNGDTSDIINPAYHYSVTGSYPVKLVAVDGWGCTDSITKNVFVNPPPTITTGGDTTVCAGDQATLQGYGGISYSWAPAATLSCATCQTTLATTTAVTTYTVTGTDAKGCINTDTVTVHMRYYTISKGWGDTEVCKYVPVQLFDSGGNKYNWIPAAGLSDPTIANPIATPDITTNYMVIAQLGRCIPDTNYVQVIVHQPPVVDAGPNQRIVNGQPVQLHATGSFVANYSWQPAKVLACDTCATTIAHILSTTTFTVSATSSFGCKSYDTTVVVLYCDKDQVFVPNSFTPNHDGKNDVFYPRGTGIAIIKAFRIYNRWGELMFERLNLEANDASNAWDGSYMGDGPRPDVYVYLIDAVCDSGEPILVKGDVTIIK